MLNIRLGKDERSGPTPAVQAQKQMKQKKRAINRKSIVAQNWGERVMHQASTVHAPESTQKQDPDVWLSMETQSSGRSPFLLAYDATVSIHSSCISPCSLRYTGDKFTKTVKQCRVIVITDEWGVGVRWDFGRRGRRRVFSRARSYSIYAGVDAYVG